MRAYVLASALVLALNACTPDPCGAQSPCPNDPRTTPAQSAMCRSALDANRSSACFAELLDLATCAQANVACNASGTTDPALTQTRQRNECSRQISALQVCCTSNRTASACQ